MSLSELHLSDLEVPRCSGTACPLRHYPPCLLHQKSNRSANFDKMNLKREAIKIQISLKSVLLSRHNILKWLYLIVGRDEILSEVPAWDIDNDKPYHSPTQLQRNFISQLDIPRTHHHHNPSNQPPTTTFKMDMYAPIPSSSFYHLSTPLTT